MSGEDESLTLYDYYINNATTIEQYARRISIDGWVAIFNSADTNGDGSISSEEFESDGATQLRDLVEEERYMNETPIYQQMFDRWLRFFKSWFPEGTLNKIDNFWFWFVVGVLVIMALSFLTARTDEAVPATAVRADAPSRVGAVAGQTWGKLKWLFTLPFSLLSSLLPFLPIVILGVALYFIYPMIKCILSKVEEGDIEWTEVMECFKDMGEELKEIVEGIVEQVNDATINYATSTGRDLINENLSEETQHSLLVTGAVLDAVLQPELDEAGLYDRYHWNLPSNVGYSTDDNKLTECMGGNRYYKKKCYLTEDNTSLIITSDTSSTPHKLYEAGQEPILYDPNVYEPGPINQTRGHYSPEWSRTDPEDNYSYRHRHKQAAIESNILVDLCSQFKNGGDCAEYKEDNESKCEWDDGEARAPECLARDDGAFINMTCTSAGVLGQSIGDDGESCRAVPGCDYVPEIEERPEVRANPVCKWKEDQECSSWNPDAQEGDFYLYNDAGERVQRRDIETCDKLEDQSDNPSSSAYKCKWEGNMIMNQYMRGDETTTIGECKTVPKYILNPETDEYNTNIPGREYNINRHSPHYYVGCMTDVHDTSDSDYLPIYSNSGLISERDMVNDQGGIYLDVCNLETLKHMVYHNDQNPPTFTPNMGQQITTDEFMGSCYSDSYSLDAYSKLGIQPSQFRIPFCYEFNTKRAECAGMQVPLSQEEQGRWDMLNCDVELSGGGVSCTDDSECGSGVACVDNQCEWSNNSSIMEVLRIDSKPELESCHEERTRGQCTGTTTAPVTLNDGTTSHNCTDIFDNYTVEGTMTDELTLDGNASGELVGWEIATIDPRLSSSHRWQTGDITTYDPGTKQVAVAWHSPNPAPTNNGTEYKLRFHKLEQEESCTVVGADESRTVQITQRDTEACSGVVLGEGYRSEVDCLAVRLENSLNSAWKAESDRLRGIAGLPTLSESGRGVPAAADTEGHGLVNLEEEARSERGFAATAALVPSRGVAAPLTPSEVNEKILEWNTVTIEGETDEEKKERLIRMLINHHYPHNTALHESEIDWLACTYTPQDPPQPTAQSDCENISKISGNPECTFNRSSRDCSLAVINGEITDDGEQCYQINAKNICNNDGGESNLTKCEWIGPEQGGRCVYKPEKICILDEISPNVSLLNEEECTSPAMQNLTEWRPPGVSRLEGECIEKDCTINYQSKCSDFTLEPELYIRNPCHYTTGNMCDIPDGTILGEDFDCPAGERNICPGNYIYDNNDNKCKYVCNSTDHIFNEFNCPYCVDGAEHRGDNDMISLSNWDPADIDKYDLTTDSQKFIPSSDYTAYNDLDKVGGNYLDRRLCPKDYRCYRGEGDTDKPGSKNICLNETISDASISELHKTLCFNNNDGNNDYWNFGGYSDLSEGGGTPEWLCDKYSEDISEYYSQTKGYSPIIQTVFQSPENTPFKDHQLCIQKPGISNYSHCPDDQNNCDPNNCILIDKFNSNKIYTSTELPHGVCHSDCLNDDQSPTCSNLNSQEDIVEKCSGCGVRHLDNPNVCRPGSQGYPELNDDSDSAYKIISTYNLCESNQGQGSKRDCRLNRYNYSHKTLLNLRESLNITLDERIDSNHIFKNENIDTLNKDGGVSEIGVVHPCANEDAYTDFIKKLREKKDSNDISKIIEYKKAICKLNTGGEPPLNAIDSGNNCRPLTDDSVLPINTASDEVKRMWITAGETKYKIPITYPNSLGLGLTSETNPSYLLNGHPCPKHLVDLGLCDTLTWENENDDWYINQYGNGVAGSPGEINFKIDETSTNLDTRPSNIFRSKYGNISEQLCFYSVEEGSIIPLFSDSLLEDLRYNNLIDNSINSTHQICSKCRQSGAQDRSNYCMTQGCVNPAHSILSAGDLQCNKDGSCRCSEYNIEGDRVVSNNRSFYIDPDPDPDPDPSASACSGFTAVAGDAAASQTNCEATGACRYTAEDSSATPPIAETCAPTTALDEGWQCIQTTCKYGSKLLYKTDKENEAIFSNIGGVNVPLCNCRTSELDTFGSDCSKIDDEPAEGMKYDYKNSCNGAYSEWEFSVHGSDYKEIDYMHDHIDLSGKSSISLGDPKEDEVLKYLLNYFKLRIMAICDMIHTDCLNTAQASNTVLQTQFDTFFNNIGNRTGKYIDNWSELFQTLPENPEEVDWNNFEYRFPYKLRDLLVEIHENANLYSPGTIDDPADYIFPNHSNSRGSDHSDLNTYASIESVDALFYYFYRNTDLGPTYCDCTKTNNQISLIHPKTSNPVWKKELFDPEFVGGGEGTPQLLNEDIGSPDFPTNAGTHLVRFVEHPGASAQAGERVDQYQYKGWKKEGRWGYRCENKTDCKSGESFGGYPIYGSLGWSLDSDLFPGIGMSMDNYGLRDNYGIKDSDGEFKYLSPENGIDFYTGSPSTEDKGWVLSYNHGKGGGAGKTGPHTTETNWLRTYGLGPGMTVTQVPCTYDDCSEAPGTQGTRRSGGGQSALAYSKTFNLGSDPHGILKEGVPNEVTGCYYIDDTGVKRPCKTPSEERILSVDEITQPDLRAWRRQYEDWGDHVRRPSPPQLSLNAIYEEHEGPIEGSSYVNISRRKGGKTYDASWTDIEINNEIIKYDIDKESGRLPDFFDPKGNDPLICDCSYSLGDSDFGVYQSAMDGVLGPRATTKAEWISTPASEVADGASGGDYCELPMTVNENLVRRLSVPNAYDLNDNEQITERYRLNYLNDDESYREDSGYCKSDGLMTSFDLFEIENLSKNNRLLAREPIPGNNCANWDFNDHPPSNDPNAPHLVDTDWSFTGKGCYNGEDGKGESYLGNPLKCHSFSDKIRITTRADGSPYEASWSCKGGNSPDRTAGENTCTSENNCVCSGGTCMNANLPAVFPINYSTGNTTSRNDKPTEWDNDLVHPKTDSSRYQDFSNDWWIDEYQKREIPIVLEELKSQNCGCNPDSLRGELGMGCLFEDDHHSFCNGKGTAIECDGSSEIQCPTIRLEKDGTKYTCICDAGYGGSDCSTCDGNHYDYPNCTEKVADGECCPDQSLDDTYTDGCATGWCDYELVGCHQCLDR